MLTNALIRPAQLGDLQAVHNIDQEVFGPAAYSYIVLRQLYDLASELFLVADKRGVVGYIIAAPKLGGKIAWIMTLAVRLQYRERGVGKVLLEEALLRLKRLGFEKVYLTVSPGNETAIELYRKSGFEEASVAEDYFAEGDTKLIMQKSLR